MLADGSAKPGSVTGGGAGSGAGGGCVSSKLTPEMAGFTPAPPARSMGRSASSRAGIKAGEGSARVNAAPASAFCERAARPAGSITRASCWNAAYIVMPPESKRGLAGGDQIFEPVALSNVSSRSGRLQRLVALLAPGVHGYGGDSAIQEKPGGVGGLDPHALSFAQIHFGGGRGKPHGAFDHGNAAP